jgi:ferrous iron transport protein B
MADQKFPEISLIGNPNSGKSTIFNLLTGKNQKTGNWSGVTIDKKSGFFESKKEKYQILDLPGIYSLDPSISKSEDEKISQKNIIENKDQIFLNVIDSSNLEKSLFLTTELIDLNKPMILVLNMMDLADENKIIIDIERLSAIFGIKIIKMNAKNAHIDELKNAIIDICQNQTLPKRGVEFNQKITEAINIISKKTDLNKWQILEYLKKLQIKSEEIIDFSTEEKEIISQNSGQKIDFNIINDRYKFINIIISSILRKNSNFTRNISDKIDQIIMNPIAGIIVFLATLYLMFFFAINIGGAFIDFFDIIAGSIFVDLTENIFTFLNFPKSLIIILSHGIGGAIQTLCNFIPIIFFLYLFLNLLENTGYMTRLAFISRRFTKLAGLPDKSFISLVMGFGCTVPAIMSTRTMKNFNHRIITIFMLPFVSCGAKMPIYILFAAAFFPENGQNIIFLLYLTGLILAIITGIILNKGFVKSDSGSMILDLPAFSIPKFGIIIKESYLKVRNFIFGTGKNLIPIIMVLTMLNSFGTDFSFQKNNENSILSKIGKATTPIFYPMGIKNDNWQAAVGIFTGMFAKEVLVGTLDNLYRDQISEDQIDDYNFSSDIKNAFFTLGNNLIDLSNQIIDPIGMKIDKIEDLKMESEKQEIELSTFKTMREKFDGKIGAFAFLLFILLYSPCMTALATSKKEVGKKWTILSAVWATILAYIIAVGFYQLGVIIS